MSLPSIVLASKGEVGLSSRMQPGRACAEMENHPDRRDQGGRRVLSSNEQDDRVLYK